MASWLLPLVTILASVGVIMKPVPFSSKHLIIGELSSVTSEALYLIKNVKALLAFCKGCSKGLYLTILRASPVCLKALLIHPSPPQLKPLNSVVTFSYVHSSLFVSSLLRPCAVNLSCMPSVGSTIFKSDFVTFRLNKYWVVPQTNLQLSTP